MTTEETGVAWRTPAKADRFFVLGDTLALRGELADVPFVMVDVTIPPGSGVPPHMHPSPETFRVLSGCVTFWRIGSTGPEEIAAGPGDVVAVPSGEPHGYRNSGSEPAEVMVILDNRMISFFRSLASDAPLIGPPTPDVLARVGEATLAHSIEMLDAA